MKKEMIDSLAHSVGEAWKQLQQEKTQKGIFYISVPLSSTPLPLYQWVVDHALEFTNWQRVKFVLMDEMLEEGIPQQYVSLDDPASYEGFAKKHFLDPLSKKIGISLEVVKPDLNSIEQFSTPIDLLILALGPEGNYANVMPGISEDNGWHIAHLSPVFRQSHTSSGSKSYGGAHFREHGMSLGPKQLFEATHIWVIISGIKKQEVTKRLFSYTAFDPTFPLSLIYHADIHNKVRIFFTHDVVVQ